MILKKIMPCSMMILVYVLIALPANAGESLSTVVGPGETIKQQSIIIQKAGRVDRIGANVIVVDDFFARLASNYEKRNYGGDFGEYQGSISTGMYVGFHTNEKNEVTTLWVFSSKEACQKYKDEKRRKEDESSQNN